MRAAADEAARSVIALYCRPLFGIPGTNLCALQRPAAPRIRWTYWWQAHFVDCLVDALRRGSSEASPALFDAQLRGMWLMQGLRFRNRYYDDMAWLALAAQRGGRTIASLEPVLRRAISEQWGGGAFWSVEHEFKNTPATAPISLYLARLGDHDTARRLTHWLTDRLADPDTGLFRDGMRLGPDGTLNIEGHLFTYNQGPVLGTWLELGDDESLAAIETLVGAVADHLTLPGTRVLKTHGSGDGGLFTGILVRYLALVATDARPSSDTRQVAAELVIDTAENLWEGRVTRGWRHVPVTCFPQDTSIEHGEVGERVELSTQLQAWMSFEAAQQVRG